MPFETPDRKIEREEAAARLVVRVRDGAAGAALEAESWIAGDPANAVAYARADAAWDRAGGMAPPGAEDDPALPSEEAQASCPSRFTRRALVAGLVGVAGAGLGVGIPAIRRLFDGRTINTAVGERRDITLADGSVLRLNTASRVEVRMMADKRIVRLFDGEALFDVAPDPRRPFFVDVGYARIRAVGTEFNVRLRQDLIELTVTEGTVAVANPEEERPLGELPHFSAGSAAAIHRGVVARTEVDSEALRQRTAWRDGVIELDGNTVDQAVAEFNRYRSTPIIVGDQRLSTIRIGGRFGTSESDRFIAALQQTLPVQVVPGEKGIMLLVQAD